MRRYSQTIVAVLLLAGAATLHASGRRLGTSAAAELLIPMGARGMALAGADIAAIGGNEAMYYNPAGLARLESLEAGFSYTTHFADMNLSYFTLGSRFNGPNAVGVSLQVMDIGDIPVTTIDNPEGTGEIVTPNFITLSGTYARAFTDRIHFGLNVKLISERVGDMQASAVAMDAGLQYRSPLGIDLGVVLRNYGSTMQFDGTSIEFDSEIPYANPNATTRKSKMDMATHQLPTSLNMGLAYSHELSEMHGLHAAVNYAGNSFDIDYIHTGLEYAFNRMIYLRAGYRIPLYGEDYPEGEKENQYGVCLGFGFHLLVSGRTIMFDYAWRDMDLFDANQVFSVRVGL